MVAPTLFSNFEQVTKDTFSIAPLFVTEARAMEQFFTVPLLVRFG